MNKISFLLVSIILLLNNINIWCCRIFHEPVKTAPKEFSDYAQYKFKPAKLNAKQKHRIKPRKTFFQKQYLEQQNEFLRQAVTQNKEKETFDALARGAKINYKDEKGRTPLMLSALLCVYCPSNRPTLFKKLLTVPNIDTNGVKELISQKIEYYRADWGHADDMDDLCEDMWRREVCENLEVCKEALKEKNTL